MSMECRETQALLAAYAAGSLEPRIWAAARSHLRACPACRLALGRVDDLAGLAAGMTDPPVPAALADRILAAARARGAAAGRGKIEAAGDWNPAHWWHAATRSMRWATLSLGLAGLALGIFASTFALPASEPTSTDAADPLDSHAIDFLAYAPDGSLTGSYLALVQSDGEGR